MNWVGVRLIPVLRNRGNGCASTKSVSVEYRHTTPSTPAPAIVLSRASGSPIPIDVTLQGLIEDDGAANSRGVSLTNAMIVRVS
ncbi:MAG: hypothetical protein HY292_28600 [Planctomycetes bacterium]|nr:hypothetical protein [Planctomycetota bacterium]